MDDNAERPSYEPELTQPPVADSAEKYNAFQRLWMMFTSPGAVFADIRIKPSWALVLLFLAILGVGYQAVIIPHLEIEKVVLERLEEQPQNLSEAQKANVVKIAEMIARAQVVIFPLGALFIAATVYLLILKMVGSEVDFSRSLSTTLHSYWPPTLVGLALSAVLFQRFGKVPVEEVSTVVKDNLGALLSSDAPTWLIAGASTISIFNIWTIILLIMGFASVGRISRAQAAVVTLVPWLVYLIGKMGFAALQS